MNKIKRALISVWDKEGIVELAEFLSKNDIEIISTGGTKKVLKNNGIPVTSVSELTNQKEIMDGRVKTLNPKIFAGILANRDKKQHMLDLENENSLLIDLVIINLYPFKEEAVEKKLNHSNAIEYIDIGGPSLLRASAKNHQYVVPLCNVNQYQYFIEIFKENDGLIPIEDRVSFAKKVYKLTSSYDSMIFDYFDNNNDSSNLKISFNNQNFLIDNNLRYGENPHQDACYYKSDNKEEVIRQLHGKELSYNNYFDIESAIKIVLEFQKPACSIIKHANPCGFGIGNDNLDSYKKAVSTDPVSYFGGIVAFNHSVDKHVAEEMSKSFLECIVAPGFTSDAIAILKKKKNLRIIIIKKDEILNNIPNYNLRTVFNGFLYQKNDCFINKINDFEIVSKRKPTSNEFSSLELGWKLVKFVKSNAIVFANHEKLLGVGAGQMSRVDSVKIAIRKSKENDLNLNGSIMASDAFFPFTDSIELASESGIAGVIQPGGSIKDDEIIKIADELNLIMIFTKERHFYH